LSSGQIEKENRKEIIMMSNEEKILSMLVELKESTDKRFESMDKRFEAIDKRLDTMEERMDRLDERSQRTAVLLETEVDRKLNLLYEGHETIMECLDKLAPKDRVDELETDVIVLKTAVKMLTQEIAELKKAQ
jgi:archaellum component FlaC